MQSSTASDDLREVASRTPAGEAASQPQPRGPFIELSHPAGEGPEDVGEPDFVSTIEVIADHLSDLHAAFGDGDEDMTDAIEELSHEDTGFDYDKVRFRL